MKIHASNAARRMYCIQILPPITRQRGHFDNDCAVSILFSQSLRLLLSRLNYGNDKE
jgi:hypothetical protein